MSQVACALTIAGTDPTGGAGVQADLKTFQELQTYGMSVITSVVAQNTTGVQAVHHVPLEIIEAQLDSVFTDMPVHAFKTGMIANIEMMEIIYQQISTKNIPYVIDPVMVATSGDVLISEAAREYLREQLLPLCTVVTPNIPEASYLTGLQIESIDDMKLAAETIVRQFGAKSALITGGHLPNEATDVFFNGEDFFILHEHKIATKNTHGTGCTYSAAITAYLSHGLSLQEAVKKAKRFVTKAIANAFPLGAGNGPTNHWGIRL